VCRWGGGGGMYRPLILNSFVTIPMLTAV